MVSILKKELNGFFTGAMGYLVIGLFLLINGLLLWFFKGNWNIFNTGFADMQAFFDTTPWLFLVLIPAISMKSFSDEYTSGTIELLKTKPLSNWQIVMGKFLAIFLLVVFTLIPTKIYVFSLYKLASPETIDLGSILGSYIGLLALALSFSAIGLFTSILSTTQIISFLMGVLISFLLFYGIEQWAIWTPNSIPDILRDNSLYTHYNNIAKGVLDTRDLIYFFSISFLFLYLTKIKLDQ